MSENSPPTKEAVIAALRAVQDPKSGRDLVDAGLVQAVSVREDRVGFMMEVPPELVTRYGPVRDAAEAVLKAIPGVAKAQVVLTAAAAPPAPGQTRVRKGAKINEDPQAKPNATEAERPAYVKRVIAVASGKGGVGKSTVSTNLACAFAALGLRVGLLDADVYGPSAPKMMGVDHEPKFEDGKLTPLSAHGVKVMSIGFLVDEGAPMIWRGPMASSAVRQMMGDVRWGTEAEPLDILVVDLPPGTGDIHLTLVQKLKVDGVVIVSTPQEIALIDVRRAAGMYAKTGTPILGVIENMAYFPNPATGERIPIFGEGGAKAEAARMGAPLLAELPIDMAVRIAGDEGVPLTVRDPGGDIAQSFKAAAQALL
ncbi:MAG: Mrp/NBP35 family ATP-binding protein [Caulobacteraceae bacterium]